jgi:hypothetical protein
VVNQPAEPEDDDAITPPPHARAVFRDAIAKAAIQAPIANRFRLLPSSDGGNSDFVVLVLATWLGYSTREGEEPTPYGAAHGAATMPKTLLQDLVDELARDYGIVARGEEEAPDDE